MIIVRRGGTLKWDGQLTSAAGIPQNLTGWAVASMVRATVDSDALIQSLTVVVVVGTLGLFTISATPVQTAAWPLGSLSADVRFTDPGGDVTISDPFLLRVVNAVTR